VFYSLQCRQCLCWRCCRRWTGDGLPFHACPMETPKFGDITLVLPLVVWYYRIQGVRVQCFLFPFISSALACYCLLDGVLKVHWRFLTPIGWMFSPLFCLLDNVNVGAAADVGRVMACHFMHAPRTTSNWRCMIAGTLVLPLVVSNFGFSG
jgi:hypothetical protein